MPGSSGGRRASPRRRPASWARCPVGTCSRSVVSAVTVRQDAGQENLLHIDITYLVKGENDERNLVFPFYTIPAEE